MVTIGSARISENGTINGVKGDQNNGKEVSTQNWYLSNKGWVVIRPVNPTVASKIAEAMSIICKANVGYSQVDRYDLYNKAKKLGFKLNELGAIPCNVDCSEAVRVCLAYAGIHVNSFTTANEVSMLNATKHFTILTGDKYCKKSDYLRKGDILVTRTKGHTVVCITDGAKHNEDIHPELQKGDKGHHVGVLQRYLNYKNVMGGNLVEDNDFGNITLNHLIDFCAINGLPKSGKCTKAVWDKLLN